MGKEKYSLRVERARSMLALRSNQRRERTTPASRQEQAKQRHRPRSRGNADRDAPAGLGHVLLGIGLQNDGRGIGGGLSGRGRVRGGGCVCRGLRGPEVGNRGVYAEVRPLGRGCIARGPGLAAKQRERVGAAGTEVAGIAESVRVGVELVGVRNLGAVVVELEGWARHSGWKPVTFALIGTISSGGAFEGSADR